MAKPQFGRRLIKQLKQIWDCDEERVVRIILWQLWEDGKITGNQQSEILDEIYK